MAKKPGKTRKPTGLRRKAEELLCATNHDVAAMPVKDMQQLVHELQIHQIELEMQNDELRRTQLELQAARDRYVDLYDFSPAGHFTLNTHGKIVEANLRAGTMLGINRKELIGQPLARFIASDDQDIFHRHCQDVVKTGTRQACEVRLRDGTAGVCCVYFESLALHDETGHITHWRTALLDVSARRLAEEKMSAQRAQLDAIISSAMDAIISVDEGECVVVFNRAAESMFLCQAADVIGQPVDRFIPERFRQVHHGHMRFFALRQSTSRSMGRPGELFGLRANGEEFPVEASISRVLVSGKKLLTVILRDVTERKRAEEALRASEAHLQAILDNSPGMVFLKDVEGRYLHVNRQFERVFHMTHEQVVGKTDEAIFSPELAAVFRANDLKVLQAGVPLEFEEVAMHDDGPHTSIVSKFPLCGGDGKPYALCGITTDITWRKNVEEALHSSEAFTRAILDSLSAHVCVLDKEGIILKTNDAWKEFGSCNTSRVVPIDDVGQNYLDVCRRAIAAGDSTSQVILGGIETVLEGSQTSFSAEYPCHSPEVERWFLMRVTPLKDTKGVVISHTDISGRVRMSQALEKHVRLLSEKQKELEFLAEKLIEAQEEERKRIARELHDDFNQRLAALSLELETMEGVPIDPSEPVARKLAAVRAQVGQLSDDLHDLAYRLHPSLLEHVGLAAAAQDHVAEFTRRTGLPVTFTAREVPEILSLEVATNLFRVMQESLQNVSRHAQATEVMVRLSGSSKGIGLSVRDNGKGFDHENKSGREKGLGLVSMEERARGLGGFLRIHSLPSAGTKVCAWIPRYKKGA
jgi:PAS domain S-box-containing protein